MAAERKAAKKAARKAENMRKDKTKKNLADPEVRPEKVLEVPTSTALAAVWVAYHTRKKAKRGLWKAEIIKERNEDKGINQK